MVTCIFCRQILSDCFRISFRRVRHWNDCGHLRAVEIWNSFFPQDQWYMDVCIVLGSISRNSWFIVPSFLLPMAYEQLSDESRVAPSVENGKSWCVYCLPSSWMAPKLFFAHGPLLVVPLRPECPSISQSFTILQSQSLKSLSWHDWISELLWKCVNLPNIEHLDLLQC